VDFYFCSPILNFTHIWRVGEWLSAPLLLWPQQPTMDSWLWSLWIPFTVPYTFLFSGGPEVSCAFLFRFQVWVEWKLNLYPGSCN
jgi:hypothetical protein